MLQGIDKIFFFCHYFYMAKKKVVKKVVKKPVRPTVRSVSSSRSSKGFFQKHKNLKWILPLFVILLVVLLLVRHNLEERMENSENNPLKQDVRNMLHLNSDTDQPILTATPTPSDGSTITPYITLTPTPEATGY